MESGTRGAEVTRLRTESLWSPSEKLLLSLRAQEATDSETSLGLIAAPHIGSYLKNWRKQIVWEDPLHTYSLNVMNVITVSLSI